MAFNIGVNVLEVDGKAAPTIVAAPISIAGFLIVSERGIPNLPVQVRGAQDLAAGFGELTSSSVNGMLAVRGFFDNGGSEAYVVRMAGTSRPASVTLTDRAAANTLLVSAGSLGRDDPGTWGNTLAVTIEDRPRASSGVPAQVVGTVAEPFDMNGLGLSITVNGAVTPVLVGFAAADFVNLAAASAAEVAAAINKQTTQLRASATPDQTVLIASAVAGTSSSLALVSTGANDALAALGLAAASAAGLSTTDRMVALQGTAGLVTGSAVRFETPAHVIAAAAITAPVNLTLLGGVPGFSVTANGGPAFTISFSASDFASGTLDAALSGEIAAAITRNGRGIVVCGLTSDSRLVVRTTRFGVGTSLSLDVPPAAFVDALAAIGLTGGPPVVGTAGAVTFQEVTAVNEAGSTVQLAAAPATALPMAVIRLQSAEFDVAIRRNGVEVERFESLTMQTTLPYFTEAVINDPDRGSRFVTVRRQVNASGPGANAPVDRRDAAQRPVAVGLGVPNTFGLTVVAGTDIASTDIDYIGDAATRTGLHAFDPLRIQLLACPDTQSPGVTLAALAYCEVRGDAMFVGTTPVGYDLDGAKSFATTFRGKKVYGAMYWPWIDVVNPLDTSGNTPRLTMTPVGHVLGVYARIGDTRGVFKAPAGDEAMVRGALAVERPITDVEHTDLVKNGGVNAIRAIPGSGIIVDSSRTLSTDTRWLFVGTRRLFNFVKVSLRDGLRWVAQEPHSDALRRAVKFNVVMPFLLGLWRQGAFGSDAPGEVFTIICDATNNPPAEVNLGNFKVEVYFYPVKPAETIVIVVGQQDSGATAADA